MPIRVSPPPSRALLMRRLIAVVSKVAGNGRSPTQAEPVTVYHDRRACFAEHSVLFFIRRSGDLYYCSFSRRLFLANGQNHVPTPKRVYNEQINGPPRRLASVFASPIVTYVSRRGGLGRESCAILAGNSDPIKFCRLHGRGREAKLLDRALRGRKLLEILCIIKRNRFDLYY